MTEYTNYETTMKIIKWARKHGALLIKVGGVELTFPPDIDAPLLQTQRIVDIDMKTENTKAEEFIRAPSALDDPDYYISEQDKWATNTRPPPLR